MALYLLVLRKDRHHLLTFGKGSHPQEGVLHEKLTLSMVCQSQYYHTQIARLQVCGQVPQFKIKAQNQSEGMEEASSSLRSQLQTRYELRYDESHR